MTNREIRLAVLNERRRWLQQKRQAAVWGAIFGGVFLGGSIFLDAREARTTLGACGLIGLLSSIFLKIDTEKSIKNDDAEAASLGSPRTALDLASSDSGQS